MNRTPRDVLADRIEMWTDDTPYDYADRLIKDLFDAGYDIVAREPVTRKARPGVA